jgi:hypothetical protein
MLKQHSDIKLPIRKKITVPEGGGLHETYLLLSEQVARQNSLDGMSMSHNASFKV